MGRHGSRYAAARRGAEPAKTPALSIALGYGAIAPLALGALAVWTATGELRAFTSDLVVLWAATILVFLAGVRRGLSFCTVGGPTLAQILMMFWLFGLGLLALLLRAQGLALLILIAGYLSLALLDPWAARRGEVPLFFARLRPAQMTIAVLSLAAVLARLVFQS